MVDREFHYYWEWDLHAEPEAIWPLVADTDRFNRDTRLPPVRRLGGPGLGATDPRQRLWFRVLGLPLEWDEQPFEWIRPVRFGVVRRYWRGPVAEMRVLVELNPRAGGGTRLVYQVWAVPRSILGLLAIPLQIGWISARRFAAIIRHYDRAIVEGRPFNGARRRLDAGAEARLEDLRTKLAGDGAPPDLSGRLITLICEADDLTLARLRPYALADLWGASATWSATRRPRPATRFWSQPGSIHPVCWPASRRRAAASGSACWSRRRSS